MVCKDQRKQVVGKWSQQVKEVSCEKEGLGVSWLVYV